MVDNPVDLQDRQRAKAAFAASAILDHADAGLFERLEHRLIGGNRDLNAEPRNLLLNSAEG